MSNEKHRYFIVHMEHKQSYVQFTISLCAWMKWCIQCIIILLDHLQWLKKGKKVLPKSKTILNSFSWFVRRVISFIWYTSHEPQNHLFDEIPLFWWRPSIVFTLSLPLRQQNFNLEKSVVLYFAFPWSLSCICCTVRVEIHASCTVLNRRWYSRKPTRSWTCHRKVQHLTFFSKDD